MATRSEEAARQLAITRTAQAAVDKILNDTRTALTKVRQSGASEGTASVLLAVHDKLAGESIVLGNTVTHLESQASEAKADEGNIANSFIKKSQKERDSRPSPFRPAA